MPFNVMLVNGGAELARVADPPPILAPAPVAVALAPASSFPPIDPALMAAAGVTQAQVDAANAAAAATAAGVAALMAGEGSAGIAAAEQAAGAPQSVLDAIATAGIPDITGLVVTGTDGSGGAVGGTDDLDAARRLAEGNLPDLSGLPEWELIDPFSLRELAAVNLPLKGGSALAAIAQACSDDGVDALACVADILHEGAGGTIGDGGLAYGPTQDHLTEFPDRPFYGRGANNATVNAWAWTENGIRYAVRQMVASNPSARGLRGHAAVYAIVYGYERPKDKPGAYRTRAAEYDHLVALGSGWASYAAAQLKGPAAGGASDTQPLDPGTAAPYKPAGVTAQWRDLVDVFRVNVPRQHGKVDSIAKSLVEVFR